VSACAPVRVMLADLMGCGAPVLMQSAQKEIALWFAVDELASYERVIDAWIYE
jgi:hypothetical protein